jgi:hypothetical protein
VGAGKILLRLSVSRGELGAEDFGEVRLRGALRSSSEVYFVRIALSSPGSSQCPPQLGYSSTTTCRFALKKWRIMFTPGHLGQLRRCSSLP